RAEDYTVKKGDCLWNIAIAHHVTLAALEHANPQIKNPNLIFPGEIVHIPRGSSNNASSHPTTKPKPKKPKPPTYTPPVATNPAPPKPPVTTPPPPPTTTPPTKPPVTPPPAPTPTPIPPTFVLNFGGPEIDVTTPARGAQLPVGAVAVKGKAIDNDGIQ